MKLNFSFGKIKNISDYNIVKELNLSNSKLTEIPDWVFELKNLQKLILNWNCLKCIPEKILELKKLTHLELMYNEISEIIKIENLKHLNILAISYF